MIVFGHGDGRWVAGRCTEYSVGGAVWLVQITENGKRKTVAAGWRVKGGGEHGRERGKWQDFSAPYESALYFVLCMYSYGWECGW